MVPEGETVEVPVATPRGYLKDPGLWSVRAHPVALVAYTSRRNATSYRAELLHTT